MIGHVTYLSDQSMHEKFGRRLRDKEVVGYDFTLDFEVESYLQHQGEVFTRRFDANTYLYITKALDYFDLGNTYGTLVEAFREVPADARFLVIAFSSDWLYPPYQSKEIVRALKGNGLDCTYLEIASTYGHDAFLLESDQQTHLLTHFLDVTARRAGVHQDVGARWTSARPHDLADLNLTPTSDAAVLDRIARNAAGERLDHLFIVDVIEPRSRVLDLGCGRGTLLQMLVERKDVRGTGVEISEDKVYEAVGKGLSVYHGDIDEGLSYYPDAMFDYVILSQTLQEARETILVMHEALRVGRYLIASFPNFGHWRARLQLLLRGRAPVTPALPYEWYDTPNIHSLTVKDFEESSRSSRGCARCDASSSAVMQRSAILAESVRRAWGLRARAGDALVPRPAAEVSNEAPGDSEVR